MKKTQSSAKDSTDQNAEFRYLSAEIISRSDDEFTIQISIPYIASMLKSEEIIQTQLNEAGIKATLEVLSRFDTDGSPIQHGPTTFFSKGKEASPLKVLKSHDLRPANNLAVDTCGVFGSLIRFGAGFLGREGVFGISKVSLYLRAFEDIR